MRKRRKNGRQVRIVISVSLCLLLVMTVGYAAFSTNLALTAKGNIVTTPDSCFTTFDNGDGTLSITDYDKSCGSKVKIPSKISGITVSKIAPAEYTPSTGNTKSFAKKGIEKVIIPEGIKEIGQAAFDVNFISELKLPSTIEKIGNVAFRHNNIIKLELPNKYFNMGDSVFNDNKLSDEDAFIFKINSDGTFDNTIVSSYGGARSDNITIPKTVRTLDRWSFRALPFTGTFSIPDTVENIGESALEWNSFTEYNIGNGVKTIGASAFGYNSKLTTVTIGKGITSISSNAFRENPKLTSITINRKKDAVSGEPWGATNATINWIGTE
ncbi:MAG: leucine-rich repeat domain-containing protein [Oscillospiraceae bacterium]